jgi:cellobiose phosphorylase
MGYLIADNRGRTLKDYSHIPYDLELASRIERLMDEQATLSFQVVREFFVASYGRFELPQFVSTVINRDWAVTSELVTVDRLAPEMSFRSLLERHP